MDALFGFLAQNDAEWTKRELLGRTWRRDWAMRNFQRFSGIPEKIWKIRNPGKKSDNRKMIWNWMLWAWKGTRDYQGLQGVPRGALKVVQGCQKKPLGTPQDLSGRPLGHPWAPSRDPWVARIAPGEVFWKEKAIQGPSKQGK